MKRGPLFVRVCVAFFSLKKERITHVTHTHTHADYQRVIKPTITHILHTITHTSPVFIAILLLLHTKIEITHIYQ